MPSLRELIQRRQQDSECASGRDDAAQVLSRETSPAPGGSSLNSSESSQQTPGNGQLDSEAAPGPSPDGSTTSTERQPTNSNARKRSADNLGPYTMRMPPAEREVWQAGMYLQIMQKLEEIQPMEAPYVIPSCMTTKTIVYCTQYLLCHAVPSYRGAAPRAIIALLERHPSSGLTAEVKKSEAKLGVVLKAVRRNLTDARSHVKTEIVTSLGYPHPQSNNRAGTEEREPLNIVDLVNAVIAELHKSRKITSKNGVTLSLEMCARFAFLRKMLIGHKATFWPSVDRELASLREKFCQAGNPRKAANDYFLGCLDDDIRLYGDVNFDTSFDDAGPTEYQKEVEAMAADNQTILAEGSGSDDEELEGDEE
ncbi:hypothetical protein K474DRAFT_1711320 [Panus rudis PR-1116 ss-1]|nr:hypothetical protein K474DRAFT_1711320 [Panus rudis PR-1116 ss-1]